MKRNRDTIGVQYRQLPPKEVLFTIDITTQKQKLLQAKCDCCGETLNYTEYYWVKKKHGDSYVWVRKPICCGCWNDDTSERSVKKGYQKIAYKVEKLKRIIENTPNTLEHFYS